MVERKWCSKCQHYSLIAKSETRIAELTTCTECGFQLEFRLKKPDVEPIQSLFISGDFTLHSGQKSNWKVDCGALTDKDWKVLANMISNRCKFAAVYGVPTGGQKLARELSLYCIDNDSLPTLIVDDVLTTGNSMEAAKKHVKGEAIGYVVFARGKCPDWVKALWYSGEERQSRG